jgi:hypothetical protein
MVGQVTNRGSAAATFELPGHPAWNSIGRCIRSFLEAIPMRGSDPFVVPLSASFESNRRKFAPPPRAGASRVGEPAV